MSPFWSICYFSVGLLIDLIMVSCVKFLFPEIASKTTFFTFPQQTFLLILLMFGASSIHSKYDKFKSSSTCKPCPKVDCSKKCPMIPIPDCMTECNCPEVDDSGGGEASESCLDQIREIETLKQQIKYLERKMEEESDNNNIDVKHKCKKCPKCLMSIDECPAPEPITVPEIIIPDDKPCPFVKPCDCNDPYEPSSNNEQCPACNCPNEPTCSCETSEDRKYLPPPCPSVSTECPVCETQPTECPACESCESDEDNNPRPFSLKTDYLPPTD